MKALVIGAGGVGRAIANIASRRKFLTSMVIADRSLERATVTYTNLTQPMYFTTLHPPAVVLQYNHNTNYTYSRKNTKTCKVKSQPPR